MTKQALIGARTYEFRNNRNGKTETHEVGHVMTTDMHSKFPYMVYNVAKNGSAFARVETCGVSVHEDEEAQHNILTE
ncbi:MAG: hypothetical protein J6Y10_02765 [Lachnospiraceae bacterium]|nr:hypothetical protein [Lachnospiraceae bacterium]